MIYSCASHKKVTFATLFLTPSSTLCNSCLEVRVTYLRSHNQCVSLFVLKMETGLHVQCHAHACSISWEEEPSGTILFFLSHPVKLVQRHQKRCIRKFPGAYANHLYLAHSLGCQLPRWVPKEMQGASPERVGSYLLQSFLPCDVIFPVLTG